MCESTQTIAPAQMTTFRPMLRSWGDHRARMDRVDQFDAFVGQVFRVAESRAVVADRDDRASYLLLSKFRDVVDRAEHGQVVDARADERRIGIEKSNRTDL